MGQDKKLTEGLKSMNMGNEKDDMGLKIGDFLAVDSWIDDDFDVDSMLNGTPLNRTDAAAEDDWEDTDDEQKVSHKVRERRAVRGDAKGGQDWRRKSGGMGRGDGASKKDKPVVRGREEGKEYPRNRESRARDHDSNHASKSLPKGPRKMRRFLEEGGEGQEEEYDDADHDNDDYKGDTHHSSRGRSQHKNKPQRHHRNGSKDHTDTDKLARDIARLMPVEGWRAKDVQEADHVTRSKEETEHNYIHNHSHRHSKPERSKAERSREREPAGRGKALPSRWGGAVDATQAGLEDRHHAVPERRERHRKSKQDKKQELAREHEGAGVAVGDVAHGADAKHEHLFHGNSRTNNVGKKERKREKKDGEASNSPLPSRWA